jgi:hypothetical protein
MLTAKEMNELSKFGLKIEQEKEEGGNIKYKLYDTGEESLDTTKPYITVYENELGEALEDAKLMAGFHVPKKDHRDNRTEEQKHLDRVKGVMMG